MAIESSDNEILESIKRKATGKLLVQVANEDGTVRDISTDKLTFEARYKIADATPLITKSSTIATQIEKFAPTLGKAYVHILPDDTAPLTKDTSLKCQLIIVDAASNVDSTMFTLPVTYRQ